MESGESVGVETLCVRHEHCARMPQWWNLHLFAYSFDLIAVYHLIAELSEIETAFLLT